MLSYSIAHEFLTGSLLVTKTSPFRLFLGEGGVGRAQGPKAVPPAITKLNLSVSR
jgi:hypothetical protein